MRNAFVAAAMAVGLGCAPAMAAPQAPIGAWKGVGLQVTAAGKQEDWTIALTLTAEGAGKIDYPSLVCGGTLAPAPQLGPLTYRETITYGARCASGGTIRLRQAPGGKLIWGWTAEGTKFSDINASAVLFPSGPVS